MNRIWLALLVALCSSLSNAEQLAGIAIVVQDQAAMRAAPRASAPQHALLWQGELLEVRGERLDFLQIYDYRRERGGFVRASQLRRISTAPESAPELLAVVRFLHGTPGSEALGIAFAAAYIQAATPAALNAEEGIEMLDALGTMADRLAARASTDSAKSKTIAAHLEVTARHGVRFSSNERDARVHVCYDGDAFRRVLALPSGAQARARAVLGLTRRECSAGAERPTEHRETHEWRAEVGRATRSPSRCSRAKPGASCGCFTRRAAAGPCRYCRLRPSSRKSATWNSPAGCRAARRCW